MINRHTVVILGWQPATSSDDCDTVLVGCPLCGEIHRHGAGKGFRGPHCMNGFPKYDYFLGDEAPAKQRFLNGDKSLLSNPFRNDRELVRQMRQTLGWNRVPIERLEKVFGEWLSGHPEPGRIRGMPSNQFDLWLHSEEFEKFAWSKCMVKHDVRFLYELNDIFRKLRLPIFDSLHRAASKFLSKRMLGA